jgi:hypothetical protein
MRYAILAGSNYIGTANQLAGCLNDLSNVRQLIEPTGITILADLRGKDMSTVNWKEALREACSKAQPGDTVFHMHSHHGTQIKDPSESDGLSEVYCPNDFDWSPEKMITDKWMAGLMKAVNPQAIWVDHSDCCHAGDSLRTLWCPNERPRYIRNRHGIIESLCGLGRRRTHLSPMVVSSPDRQGILLAASRSDQTSADAYIGGESCGAFTHYLLQAINEDKIATYEALLLRVTQLLGLGGYNQRPEIDAKLGDEHRSFGKDVLGL